MSVDQNQGELAHRNQRMRVIEARELQYQPDIQEEQFHEIRHENNAHDVLNRELDMIEEEEAPPAAADNNNQDRDWRLRQQELPIRDPFELFAVYREQVQHEEYTSQRSYLCEQICNASIFLVIDILTLIWIFVYLPKIPTRPINLAEKCWMIALMIFQFLTYAVMLISALLAYVKPQLLLVHRWHKRVFHLFNFLFMSQLLTFFSVILLDFVQLSFIIIEKVYPHTFVYTRNDNQTSNERSLDFIARSSQIFTGIILVCVCQIVMEQYRANRARMHQAEVLLQQLDKIKKYTWQENQKDGNSAWVSDQQECAFCITAFEDTDSIIQLKCHKNHVYHRDCFASYLKHIQKDRTGGEPKCPFCKKCIEFRPEHLS